MCMKIRFHFEALNSIHFHKTGHDYDHGIIFFYMSARSALPTKLNNHF